MIAIVDYGMSNLGSIKNMLRKIGIETSIACRADDIWSAEKLILPGVGAFDSGMRNLTDLGMVDVLDQKVNKKKAPILGICLGMQLMTRRSEEGSNPGLGWIEAESVRFRFNTMEGHCKVPHMGWNAIHCHKSSPLFPDEAEAHRFYFVHSYHVICHRTEDVLCSTVYSYEFVSAFQRDNIAGVQFHPEKSHRYGLRLLERFCRVF